MTDALVVPDEERRVTQRSNFALTVDRPTVALPKRIANVRKASFAAAGAFAASFVALFAFPEVLWPLSPYVGLAGGAAIVLTIASRMLQRHHGAAVRAARRWEQRLWKRDGRYLDALLTPAERVLDYCGVYVDEELRRVSQQLYVLTNLRVFVTKGAGRSTKVEHNVPLRYVRSVEGGAVSRLSGSGDFLDLERGTGLLILEFGVRRRLALLFPSADEAIRARQAIEEAKPHAPDAERGSLALVDSAGSAGELAIAGSSGLAVVDEE